VSENLHPLDIGPWCRVFPLAFEVARDHKLPLKEIRPTPAPEDMSKFGCCWPRLGVIHLVLRFKHPQTGEWMGPRPEANVWQTLAHELAHLEEERHSPRFYALLDTLLQDINDRRRV